MSDRETGAAFSSAIDDELSLVDIALALAENLKLLVLIPLLAGIVAALISFALPTMYTGTTRILPPQQQQSSAANALAQFSQLAGLAGISGLKSQADQYVGLLKSKTVLDGLIDQFNLRQVYGVEYYEDASKVLSSRSAIAIGAKDGLITIEVEEKNPQLAADLANAYVDQLRKLMTTIAVTEAAQRRLFFGKQMEEAKNNLTSAEIALRGSGIGEAELKASPGTVVGEVASLRARATAAEIKLSVMRTYASESNPEYRQAQQELMALRAELDKAQRGSAANGKGNTPEYVTRYRDYKYFEILFDLMSKQFAAARLDEAREGAIIQVVDAAKVPEKRSSPKRTLIVLITVLVALFLAAVWALIRSNLKSACSNTEFAAKLDRLRACFRFSSHPV